LEQSYPDFAASRAYFAIATRRIRYPSAAYPIRCFHAPGTPWNIKANQVTFLAEMQYGDGWIEDGKGAIEKIFLLDDVF
jgi:hypothetical protein